jgi:hypothetical protein
VSLILAAKLDSCYREIAQLRAENERLRDALEELLDVAERIRGGDMNLDPERWYLARDGARKLVAEEERQ